MKYMCIVTIRNENKIELKFFWRLRDGSALNSLPTGPCLSDFVTDPDFFGIARTLLDIKCSGWHLGASEIIAWGNLRL